MPNISIIIVVNLRINNQNKKCFDFLMTKKKNFNFKILKYFIKYLDRSFILPNNNKIFSLIYVLHTTFA